MATTDFNLEQYIDNKALDEIERETWLHDREEEAKQLHLDLETPLPNEPEGERKHSGLGVKSSTTSGC